MLPTHGLRPEHELTEQSLLTANPPALLREPEELTDPVLRILLERARDGSRPGDRADDHVVCLAIEGGGMRGAVSAGMCIVLIATRKPLSFEALASGPELRILAASLETLSLRVLADFADAEELMQAVRASTALPGLGGTPPVFGEERMTDGGLLEPIPFRTALEEGATHVLVLRTRPARYRKRESPDWETASRSATSLSWRS